jgi:hypothetical protein
MRPPTVGSTASAAAVVAETETETETEAVAMVAVGATMSSRWKKWRTSRGSYGSCAVPAAVARRRGTRTSTTCCRFC